MPDALSKTVPVWCNILNRFLFPDQPQFHELYTPPQVVSKSEHDQIVALLSSFLTALHALNISVAGLRQSIPKPLRPIWVTPESDLTPTSEIFEDFHPVICCTVSRKVAGGEISEGGYIQGAADDTENWALGLSPPVYWANREVLSSTPESRLPDIIQTLVAAYAGSTEGQMMPVKPTSYVFVTPMSGLPVGNTPSDANMVVLLPRVTEQSAWQTSAKRLDIGLGPHKLGSRNLRTALPFIMNFVRKCFAPGTAEVGQKQIIIACETGKDLSIGVTLAILCLFFEDHGRLLQDPKREGDLNKNFIRGRLGWVSISMPGANPSRATLQSVNSFLMERP